MFLILADSIMTHGPIAEAVTSVRNEPYSLPQGFSWDTLDLSSPAVVSQCSAEVTHFIINLLYEGKFWHDSRLDSIFNFRQVLLFAKHVSQLNGHLKPRKLKLRRNQQIHPLFFSYFS